jgi:acyl-CoA hydrolase
MDDVEFRKSVRQGAILRFGVSRGKVGNTSVQYSVQVFSESSSDAGPQAVFSTNITFVCLDDQGEKTPIGQTGLAGRKRP